MASDLQQVAGLVGASAAINAGYQVSVKGDPVPGLVASVIYFIMLAGLSAAFGRYDLAKIVAGTTLLAVVLYRAMPLLIGAQKLIVGVQTKPSTKG